MEAALTTLVQLDEVEPRHAAGQALHEAGQHAFGLPALQQAGAQRVVAQRRRVVHAQVGTAAAGQVDGGVQRVATEGLAQGAEGGALQFEHAFAEGGDGHRPLGGRGRKRHD